jgi:hypothetical protein
LPSKGLAMVANASVFPYIVNVNVSHLTRHSSMLLNNCMRNPALLMLSTQQLIQLSDLGTASLAAEIYDVDLK